MTLAAKICRIIATDDVFKEGIRVLLILMLLGIAFDVPHEIVAGLLVIFLAKEFA